MLRKLYQKAKRVKTISSYAQQSESSSLRKSLTMFDLICVGVGSTLGSGVFVLTGYVANKYAGPGVIFSWLIAGLASYCSATSFAELCCVIPSSGSIYAYIYVSLGEWLGYLAAACLTLECGIAAAAISRNWGVKLSNYLSSTSTDDSGVNLHAGLLMVAVVGIFLCGVETSKLTINVFTVSRMLLFAFMVTAGLSLFRTEHVADLLPRGVGGVLQGVTPLFFGLVGFEEVCCLQAESLHPSRDLPRAIFATVALVTLVYALCALALVGCVDYSNIDRQSGFSVAFAQRGSVIAAHVTVIGELLTLPLVVLASFLPQPRILYVMSEDKLIPDVFRVVDRRGTLLWGTAISGVGCVLIALFVPFSYLDEVISAGILIGFNMTNAALLLIRCDHTPNGTSGIDSVTNSTVNDDMYSQYRIPITYLLLIFSALSVVTTLLFNVIEKNLEHYSVSHTIVMGLWIVVCITLLITIAIHIYYRYKPWSGTGSNDLTKIHSYTLLHHTNNNNNNNNNNHTDTANTVQTTNNTTGDSNTHYRVPFMPFLPLFGMFVNFYLICQLSLATVACLGLYFIFSTVCYFGYGLWRQVGKNRRRYRGHNGHSNITGVSSGGSNGTGLNGQPLHTIHSNYGAVNTTTSGDGIECGQVPFNNIDHKYSSEDEEEEEEEVHSATLPSGCRHFVLDITTLHQHNNKTNSTDNNHHQNHTVTSNNHTQITKNRDWTQGAEEESA